MKNTEYIVSVCKTEFSAEHIKGVKKSVYRILRKPVVSYIHMDI